jgi:hypothetical protein
MARRSKHNITALLIGTGVVLLLFLYFTRRDVKEGFEGSCQSCEGDEKPKKGKNLLPIFDPMYNAREWCKQSVLLEDHLTHPRKRCEDCCTKHIVTLEALAEEACTLDNKGQYQDLLGGLAEKCRQVCKKMLEGEDKHQLAQELRKMRKSLMPHCRSHF